jgi:poly(hydroxyalkanoate) depolymerase family esterase
MLRCTISWAAGFEAVRGCCQSDAMRSLSDTLARLKSSPSMSSETASALEPMRVTGLNPGGLKAWRHVPAGLTGRTALVVALHGCTQTAGSFDHDTGWSTLASGHDFVVLFPEQQRANNANLCFNWFSPADTRRSGGEAASIHAMIQATIAELGVDPARIFITGLSAGGAMASVMLATYPEIFSAGAIIAGLPYGSARTMPEAFDRMRGHGLSPAAAATAAVLTASSHAGPWPSLTVFHGSADHTVAASNADACVAQWLGVHDLAGQADESAQLGLHRRRRWSDGDGRVVVEDYRIQGMGHGVPLDLGGVEACGSAGAYAFDVGLSSTRILAAAWGLLHGAPRAEMRAPSARITTTASVAGTGASTAPGATIQATIERALRQAGLMP